jgi:chloramphenicol-sensitive protein RarD
MTPLVNVLFGATFLREKLTRWQLLSVLLALIGVLNLTFGYGRFPWLALTLCVSFGLYGLLRKQSGVRPIPGLFLETTLLTPVAAGYLLYLQRGGSSAFTTSGWSMALCLITTGIVTGLPLVWFGHAARHLRLTTLGFLQYLAPSPPCHLYLHLGRARYIHRRGDLALAHGPRRRGRAGSARRALVSPYQSVAYAITSRRTDDQR